MVLDLGVSSYQIDDPARGFSFRSSGPLDMRMDRAGPTAADLVNTAAERELADILFTFGEERASRRIARAIVAARGVAVLVLSADLAELRALSDRIVVLSRGSNSSMTPRTSPRSAPTRRPSRTTSWPT